MLGTSHCVLRKVVNTRIVLVPVHIFVDIQHWCTATIVFGSKFAWVYDPKSRSDYLDAVDTIVTSKLRPLVDQTCNLTIRRSSAWHQTDGYNCGVLIVKWFETYLNVVSSTKPEGDLINLTPESISGKDLEECRYLVFQSVLATLQVANAYDEWHLFGINASPYAFVRRRRLLVSLQRG
ncbi:hypothetical protein GN958_ATG09144 [Phytophthora infestans]|uniref:Ubiquitin-like protease family profile domain-containing protein n=1 Tax=Phytophthora infestans TaxID=4787 RepID=A0A8S9UM94_PHYIN|nr:hypothetical protein GN958_ATG09144 [Phytophthora infestans]